MSFFRRHYYGFLITVICICMIALSAYAGITMSKKESEEASPVAQINSKKLTQENAAIDYTYIYDNCKHKLYETKKIDADMVNLSLSELKQKYPNLHITDFSSSSMDISKTYKTYCPNHYILTLRNDLLYVYRTQEFSDKIINTNIYTGAIIPQNKQDMLKTGKIFATQEEMKDYIIKMSNED